MWCPDDTTLNRHLCFIDPHESEPISLHSDRQFARELPDPLRTVVEACSQLAPEEEAARLGFDDAGAHRVTIQQAIKAIWLPQRLPPQHTGPEEFAYERRSQSVGDTKRDRFRYSGIGAVEPSNRQRSGGANSF